MAEITAATVMKLREMTKLPMMKCKSALAEAEGDVEKAIEILKSQLGKLILDRSENATKEGRVFVAEKPDGSEAAMVEIQCESAPVGSGEALAALGQSMADALLNGPGASLIGDGLAACTMRFDHAEDDRSRSVILATDNELAGASILTIEEAAQYAKSKKVRVFALNPVQGKDAEVSAQLENAAALTGGRSYALRDTTTVSDIIAEIQKQEATALKGQAQVVRVDSPNLAIALTLVSILGFLVLLWRVRL